MTTKDLFRWFEREAPRLLEMEPASAVAEIEGRLKQIDERLSIEWSDTDGMELIVCTSGRREAFPTAKAVAAGLKAEGWRVTGLKPARGFAFSLEWDQGELDAARLKFEPTSAEGSDAIGLRVFVPKEALAIPDLVDALWLVLETGVGEEACAEIRHVEAAALDAAPEGALPIDELGTFIDWKIRKRSFLQ